MSLQWSAPADDGGSPITGYEIRRNTTIIAATENTKYVVDGFPYPGIWKLGVRAVNANGPSPWSDHFAEANSATVTIAITGPMVISEGKPDGEVPFTLTADRPVLSTSEPLNVSVLVSETNNMIWHQDKGTKTVSFALDAQTATLIARTLDDATHESDSDVTAAIQTNSDYTVGTPASAMVTVTDNDHRAWPPTGLTATLSHLDFGLSWTAPADPGSDSILGYRIDAPEGNPDNFYTNTTAPDIVGGSNPPHDYTVRVRAFNGFGDGNWSDPIVVSVRRATITIAGNDPVIEGSDAVFTLTTDLVNRYKVNGRSVLVANVLVSESDDMVVSTNENLAAAQLCVCEHGRLRRARRANPELPAFGVIVGGSGRHDASTRVDRLIYGTAKGQRHERAKVWACLEIAAQFALDGTALMLGGTPSLSNPRPFSPLFDPVEQ